MEEKVREQWQNIEIELGALGRKTKTEVDSYEQLNENSGLFRCEGSPQMEVSRDYLYKKMKQMGLDVYYDKVGNLFGRLEGQDPKAKCVCTGSHLDTVINGGQLDGAYGIIAGLEAVRRIKEENFQPRRPIEVVAFMGEEGSAFEEALLGSAVLSGNMTEKEALSQKTLDGVTLESLMQKIKDASVRHKWMYEDTEYFIETHIEQGGILDTENIPTGCVKNIVGLCGLRIRMQGQENHAGTTPMRLRRTPMDAAL